MSTSAINYSKHKWAIAVFSNSDFYLNPWKQGLNNFFEHTGSDEDWHQCAAMRYSSEWPSLKYLQSEL